MSKVIGTFLFTQNDVLARFWRDRLSGMYLYSQHAVFTEACFIQVWMRCLLIHFDRRLPLTQTAVNPEMRLVHVCEFLCLCVL